MTHPGTGFVTPFARAALALSLLGVALAVPPRVAGRSARTSAEAASTWLRVDPGGETTCAFDTPFSFFHREGKDTSRLLVYFEGGGACWEWVSCSGMFDTNVASDELAVFRGIFDFENAENPFREYSIVFIPYCTGDVHVGDSIQRYGDSPGSRPVAHRGYRNVSAVLHWLSRRTVRPTHVVVSGTSAGSYGALFYAPRIAEMFPDATVSLIGDSGVPLLNDYPGIMKRWGTPDVVGRLRDINGPVSQDDVTLERAHVYFASRFPRALVAQVTSDRDSIQSAFYIVSGSPRAREVTYALLDSLERTVPRFRSFVVAGADHGLFVTDKLYSYAVGETRLLDWLRRATAGEPVDRHRCEGCGP